MVTGEYILPLVPLGLWGRAGRVWAGSLPQKALCIFFLPRIKGQLYLLPILVATSIGCAKWA